MTTGLAVNPLDGQIAAVESLAALAPRITEVRDRVPAIRADIAELESIAAPLSVADPATAELARRLAGEAKNKRAEIEALLRDFAAGAHALHRGFTAAIASLTAPLTRIEETMRERFTTWQRAEQRKAEKARREAEEAARAEQVRLAEEARRVEEERRLAEASALAAAGHADAADALLDRPVVVAPPIVVAPPTPVAPRIEGAVIPQRWKGRVTNLWLLIQHVAVQPEHANMLEPNESAIDLFARSTRGQAQIPGVEFYDAGRARFRHQEGVPHGQ